ncbi:MAG TPA: hypothetical protein VFY48_10385 [Solirubrobacterales bacterium]|nr:hypothetical protein [Solirubrobacterales bacterium]
METKFLLATGLVLLLATGLTACGGGGESGDSTAASTATTEQGAPAGAPEGKDQGPGDSADQQQAGDDGAGSAGGSDDSAQSPAGSGPSQSKGSAGFRTKGGDNSIQDFGKESEGEDFEEASEVVVGFLLAREKGNWATVCSYTAKATLKPIEQFTARDPKYAGKGCPELLAALLGAAPASTRASTVGDGIDSLREEGDTAFALYHGTDGVNYTLPMVKEDGQWKVGGMSPSELPG